MKILVAVRSEMFREFFPAYLPMHEVHTCDTHMAALELLEKHCYDALVLDLPLPYTGGLSVLRKLSRKPPVVLALTNLSTAFVLEEAAAAGVHAMIRIPCTLGFVAENLQAMIEKLPATES